MIRSRLGGSLILPALDSKLSALDHQAMIYLNLWLTVVLPEDVPVVAGHLARCITLSRQEAGCVKYEVYHSKRDRQKFLIFEHWTSQEDWDRHRTGRAFLEIYQPEIMPRVTREPHVCDQLIPLPA